MRLNNELTMLLRKLRYSNKLNISEQRLLKHRRIYKKFLALEEKYLEIFLALKERDPNS